MELIISAKQLGRKQALIANKVIEIGDIGTDPTVYELIKAVVTQQVREYNSKPLEKNLLPFLNQATIDEQAESGRVGFGSIYNDKKADLTQAWQSAIQAFEDGLFVLFANDEEFSGADQTIALTQTIHLTKDTVITFIRLSFLAGSYW